MNLITSATLFLLGVFGAAQATEPPKVLTEYVHWTTTGKTLSKLRIFDKKISLTYQNDTDEMTVCPFDEYKRKIEYGATSVPRKMEIKNFIHSGKKATAYLSDLSSCGDFSLVHILSLRKKKDKWKIYAIQIIPNTLPQTTEVRNRK